MPLNFTTGPDDGVGYNADGYAEEDEDDEEEGVVFEEEAEEDEQGDGGSVVSVSDYQGGDLGEELPDRMIFSEEECRVIFSLRSDVGKFMRVCGCQAGGCGREGHGAMRNTVEGRAATGTYEPVRARKYLDGRLDTFTSKEKYLADMKALQENLRAGMYAAAAGRTTKMPGPPKSTKPSREYEAKPAAFEERKLAASPASTRAKTRSSPKGPPEPPNTSPPDIAGLIGEVTKQLQLQMEQEFSRMSATLKANDKKGGRPAEEEVSTPPLLIPGEKKAWWYAVTNGRNNTNSVFGDWVGGASEYVTGVPGAAVKKYDSFEKAWEQVQRHIETQVEAPDDQYEGVNRATRAHPGGRLGSDVPVTPHPPVELLGPDPSLKKEEELFEIDLGSEIELRESLCPPGLTREQAKSMADGMVDVVALPGGFTSGEDEVGGSDLAMMSSALEELVRQGRTENDITTKSDLHWKAASRTALRTIKSRELLMRRCKMLSKGRDKVIKNTVRHNQNVLRRAGWTEPGLIKAWATSGYYARVVRDSMEAWIALHQHLLVLSLTDHMPWEYVQVEIDHHVEELEVIRNTHDSRLQALCGIYAYLRDGQAGSWHSTSLQYKRNAQVFSQAATGGQDGTDGSMSDMSSVRLSPFAGCPHCGTNTHIGDKALCPWKTLSKTQARKKGSLVLRSMADGGAVPPSDANVVP
jgi:hypothetical protein